jgi:predicted GNAT family N-acyltransferase/predicted GNAT family acetyltransferase
VTDHDLKVIRATTSEQIEAAYAVRRTVFVAEQHVDPAIERDDLDDGADHFLGLLHGEPIAAARLVVVDGKGIVGRVSVLPDARRAGIGAAVMRHVEARAMELGLAELELHAQVYVRKFYERLGWVAFGHEYDEAGIRHVSMHKPVVVIRDVRDSDGPRIEGLVGGCWDEHPGMVLDVDAEEPWMRAPATYYARAGGRMWVAEIAGELVACGGVKSIGPDVVELKSMYVARRARRRGIARELERRVEEEARRRGATRIELWSDTRFTGAHATYLALGYTQLPGSRELHDLSQSTEYPFAKDI